MRQLGRQLGRQPGPRAESRLDGWHGRVVAGLVLVLAVAALAWLHRADIMALTGAAPEAVSPAGGPLAECLQRRQGAVDTMLADGVIDAARHSLFRQRAAALCEDRFGG